MLFFRSVKKPLLRDRVGSDDRYQPGLEIFNKALLYARCFDSQISADKMGLHDHRSPSLQLLCGWELDGIYNAPNLVLRGSRPVSVATTLQSDNALSFATGQTRPITRLVKNSRIFSLTHGYRYFFALKLTLKPSFDECALVSRSFYPPDAVLGWYSGACRPRWANSTPASV